MQDSDEKKQLPLPLPLIKRQHANTLISQRAKDGYINATAMCKAAGRHFKHYNENANTKAFVAALAAEAGIPTSELIQSVSGGVPELQGTWVHPQVAIHLAQWLSPQFAVQVTQWVFEWISGGPKVVERLPYHLRRYVANMTVVPRTHFSILQELTYGLIAPMEAQGYTLPEHLVPDISEGRMFCKWLRSKDIEPNTFPTYKHRYEDGRVVDARLYPNSLLADFRAHFHEVWLPERCEDYFAERDPKALKYLPLLLPKPLKKVS
jgi:KilA-N domain